VPRGVEALAAAGCEFEIDHDAVDECGPTVFGWVTGTTELGEDDIGDWLLALVDPLGGDVVQWCLITQHNARLANGGAS